MQSNFDYEPKHTFMLIAIGILALSPFLLLPFPLFIANTLYHTPDSWYILIAEKTYSVYGVGCLFLFIAAAILFLLDRSKTAIYVSIFCVLLSGLTFYTAAQNYTSLSNDSISYRALFTTQQYTYGWDEIERVVYKKALPGEGFSEYELYFIDGNKMILVENAYVRELNRALHTRLRYEGIEVER